ncbi:hypothetical protein A9G13_06010 [Gilliamella sp. wkB178]|uniref:DUF1090 domain-containing protein n=1 Tax=Gilliamella sp. wkB178 TaxID=3120259 RepID=UPI00080DC4C9|nr:DUF1090 domain-containing protein [Gilliamella apicola]OCG07765.1 hypothetical protein A9G13_06010 [Gilliamella apicola]
MKTTTKLIGKLSILALVSLFSLASYAANQDEDQQLTCSGKKQAIEEQINFAKKNNNIHRVQGLETALNEVNTHCTDAELENKYKKEVSEKTAKVTERQQELAKAKVEGKQQKIADKQAKLKDAESELAAANAKLAKFYQQITVQ